MNEGKVMEATRICGRCFEIEGKTISNLNHKCPYNDFNKSLERARQEGSAQKEKDILEIIEMEINEEKQAIINKRNTIPKWTIVKELEFIKMRIEKMEKDVNSTKSVKEEDKK